MMALNKCIHLCETFIKYPQSTEYFRQICSYIIAMIYLNYSLFVCLLQVRLKFIIFLCVYPCPRPRVKINVVSRETPDLILLLRRKLRCIEYNLKGKLHALQNNVGGGATISKVT